MKWKRALFNSFLCGVRIVYANVKKFCTFVSQWVNQAVFRWCKRSLSLSYNWVAKTWYRVVERKIRILSKQTQGTPLRAKQTKRSIERTNSSESTRSGQYKIFIHTKLAQCTRSAFIKVYWMRRARKPNHQTHAISCVKMYKQSIFCAVCLCLSWTDPVGSREGILYGPNGRKLKHFAFETR